MTLSDVLNELIEALEATEGPVIIDWQTTQRWPSGTLAAMTQAGVFTSTKQAESIQCLQCENQCFMDVHIFTHKERPTRAFIVCEDPDKQGRIEIPLEHLQQWQTSPLHFARVIARLLNIDCKADYNHGQTNVRIGMVLSKNGRRWLSLNTSPAAVEINQHTAPLDEILYYEDGQLSIDDTRILLLAESSRQASTKKYVPSIEGLENRKRNTEAMYADWKAEYLRQSKKNPDKSDTWISIQIAKLPIAQGSASETIRKNMKP